MATFNPNQSLLPSVGGSITPMSGGGATHQEGGEVKADGTPVLLEAKLSDYTDNKPMRAALAKMAPIYFKNPDIQKDINDLFEKPTEFNTNELKIKKEVLNYIPNIFSKKIKRVFDPEKKGSIENTPESQLKLMTYIASRKIDVDKMKITLDKDKLVISYTIPGSAPESESG